MSNCPYKDKFCHPMSHHPVDCPDPCCLREFLEGVGKEAEQK